YPLLTPPTPECYPLSLHDALPIYTLHQPCSDEADREAADEVSHPDRRLEEGIGGLRVDARRRQHVADKDRRQRGDQAEPELPQRSEEHTSELQSPDHLVCRLLLEK